MTLAVVGMLNIKSIQPSIGLTFVSLLVAGAL